ncbi:head-tail connector protein [Rhodobacter capsulatus]|jgi:uncharacterized phiE125 gp8 family phage protein|uniref:PhiE125 gp8 family phage protein n=1 Tax=Rhodobacter phage RcapNL TaxID=1131316 RepID=H6WBL3_9CAUD|nr:hypothetical protein [Rhodobacter capsulatus]YP_007518392.1 head-tail adaptor [Rhodobacter phage RcapNL]AFK66517.1 hypothetical protein RHZG_00010 [Rhodobacter phage RcNL1]AFA44850.1 hypothetical protein RcapNL_00010 [Rhodobacter phage RcapNL]ETD02896.1 hypothetical protein U714_04225 [Rhodobacter capsulatus DE442]ETD79051.1 hypothetical protein U717_04230 [Rhodobacter capsulatus R121]ETE54966.1 hypothetical protein U715_04220 [Rhodobacter capsulatus Y262]
MRLTRTVAPAAAPLSVAQAKEQAEFEGDHRDSMIADQIAAAVDLLDGPTGWLGRAIVTQTWMLELPSWPSCLVLPVEPVQSVSVSYLDISGAEVQVSAESHYLLQNPGMAAELHWSSGWVPPAVSKTAPLPVRISMVAGYGDAAACPPAIRQAIRMLVAHWMAVREGVNVGNIVSEVPLAVGALLARYRRMV